MDPKLKAVLRSRKFWALLAATAAITLGYLGNSMSMAEAIQAEIAALAAYMIGTGLDNGQPPAQIGA
jgi:hypothetical protein